MITQADCASIAGEQNGMAQILTDNSGQIITWTRVDWTTPGEYVNPLFRLILTDVPEGFEPIEVVDFGAVSSKMFPTHEGPVMCNRVYASATVGLREVSQ
jgi:hypothetical protein